MSATINAGLTLIATAYSNATSAYYTPVAAGPSFLAVRITNHDPNNTATIDNQGLSNANIHLDAETSEYGNYSPCSTATPLAPLATCLLLFQATPYDPSLDALSGAFTVSGHLDAPATDVMQQSVTLSNRSVLYVGGAFHSIGGLTPLDSDQYLLASCSKDTASTTILCQNAIADTTPSANGVIERVALADNGNLYVGGALSQLGASQLGTAACVDGQTSTNQCLLALCSLGECSNAINTPQDYANNPIKAISVDHDLTLYTGGGFQSIGHDNDGGSHFFSGELHSRRVQQCL